MVFEGPEGSGKSTQARLLVEALRADGDDPVLTREPGGTPIGERVRAIILDPDHCAMLAETEALLMSAARAQHVAEVVLPALQSGRVVVCDRYVDSTLAYQGGGRGLSMEALAQIQTFATGGLRPDVRVLLDLPVEVGLERRFGDAEGVNRIDLAELAFHQRVREAYRSLAADAPDEWVVVDATEPPATVARAVRAGIAARRPPR